MFYNEVVAFHLEFNSDFRVTFEFNFIIKQHLSLFQSNTWIEPSINYIHKDIDHNKSRCYNKY